MYIEQKDGYWHREVDRHCWTHTNPRPVRVVGTLEAAETYAATPRPKPTVTNKDITSGGIGLSRAAWEAVHGPPGTDPLGYIPYETGKYRLIYGNGNVWMIDVRCEPSSPVSLDAARAESKRLIPADAVFVRTYVTSNSLRLLVDLYKSESLKSQFPADRWPGGEPGDIFVVYGPAASASRVTRIVVGAGNVTTHVMVRREREYPGW